MSDMSLFVGVFIASIVAICAFAWFHIYSGIHASLANAKIGDVFNFEYEQPLRGEPKRVLARVIEPVYTLDERAIRSLNRRSSYRRNDPVFQRTNHLVTCQTADGEVRQFYAERAKNVRKPLLAGTLFKVGVAHLF